MGFNSGFKGLNNTLKWFVCTRYCVFVFRYLYVFSILHFMFCTIFQQVLIVWPCLALKNLVPLPIGCIYVFCVWISEQTAIISPCSINWLVCITGTGCLLRGTDWIFKYNPTFCPHSVFMCFVWIWEQTAIISLYNINWRVFITETESVYCAVRTGYLNVILRSAHTVYLCVLCGSQNKQRLFPYTVLTDCFL